MKKIAGKLVATAVTTGVVLGASAGMDSKTVFAAESDGVQVPDVESTNIQIQKKKQKSR